jgi:hypothetical protein
MSYKLLSYKYKLDLVAPKRSKTIFSYLNLEILSVN